MGLVCQKQGVACRKQIRHPEIPPTLYLSTPHAFGSTGYLPKYFPSLTRAMFRALSTRRSRRGYDRLADESSIDLLEEKLRRATSLPAKFFGASKEVGAEQKFVANSAVKQAKKASKIHPIFSLFDRRRRKKATAKPEFARYMEYLKEGGRWDMNTDMPVMYYK
ncbi:hypothetical protein RJ640_011151 [Escallonia rubra]|uniref:Uncharacterized protein n=1 Tax=Escallonia rubra TaxID=112253 RepID=A0AA88QIZ4_9ASTE|nr:hypothetical protein RJ640_011151 [Escallonia rubra]